MLDDIQSGGFERGDGSMVNPLEVIEELPRAVIVAEPNGRILFWNRQAETLYGWTPDEVLGRLTSDVLVAVPDRPRAKEIMDAVRAGQTWSGDFTVLRRDGRPLRVSVVDRPICDASGATVAIVGVSEDVSEQRLLEQRTADLTDRLRLALSAAELGTFRWDMALGTVQWDARLEELFGLEPGGFDGSYETWVDLLHPDDRDDVLRIIDDAVEKKQRYTVKHRVVWPDGTVRWLQGAGEVTVDEFGEPTGTIGCTRDVTDEVLNSLELTKLTAEAVTAASQERIHRERLQFLVDINDAIALARDRRELMANVAGATVPVLADWCSVYVLPYDGGRTPHIETAHVDPAMVAYAQQLQDEFPFDPDATVGMAQVIRTGKLEFHPVIDDAWLDHVDIAEEQRKILRGLALNSAILVPLSKRGRVFGGLQLVMSKSRRQYSDDDLALSQVAAARIAASLENLRLAEAQRSIASTLQKNLLPDVLPDISGIDMAVRYWANGEGVEVGGDFYDVFRITDDEWAIVVGDVCGTGTSAAAVTALVRHTIASAAWRGDDHASVLRNLNRAMRARNTQQFCTVAYGTLRPEYAKATFTFVCGGHPLPVVVRADGSTALHGKHGTLIGCFDDIHLPTSTVGLDPGDSLVLYTDGVTDVSHPYGLTDDALLALVRRAAERADSAQALADRLQSELFGILPLDQRRDDIALLVLRVPW